MHQGYAHITTTNTKKDNKIIEKQLKRIYFNSSLDNAESVFPFKSVIQSKGKLNVIDKVNDKVNNDNDNTNDADVKGFKENLALYKEKLQGQIQKCRDYLKEVSLGPPPQAKRSSIENSSGTLKEVILENIGMKSKIKLLKRLKEMGLSMRQAPGDNETVIIVDLSSIGDDKEALDHFMSFIEKVKEKHDNTLERICTKRTLSGYERKSLSLKSIYKSNKLAKLTSDGKRLKLSDLKRYYSGQSLRLNQAFEDDIPAISIVSSDLQVNSLKISSVGSKRKRKINKLTKVKNSRSTLQNLFTSISPTVNRLAQVDKSKSIVKQKKKHNRMIKVMNLFRMLFFVKKDLVKDKDYIGKVDTQDYSFMAYPVMNMDDNKDEGVDTKSLSICTSKSDKQTETQRGSVGKVASAKSVRSKNVSINSCKKREHSGKSASGHVDISPSVVVVDAAKEYSNSEICIESERQKTPSHSICEEQPANVWGRRVSPESRKEKQLLTRVNRSPSNADGEQLAARILHQNYELHRILNQQIAIKEMIEKIQVSLERSQSGIRSNVQTRSNSEELCTSQKKSFSKVTSAECHCCKKAIDSTADCSCCNKIPQNATSGAYTNRATVATKDDCYNRSFNDSMTDIPSTLCWCPDFGEKLRILCGGSRSKSKLESSVESELEHQRREIIKLNKLLRHHILENHPS